jgi:hypothetical protein
MPEGIGYGFGSRQAFGFGNRAGSQDRRRRALDALRRRLGPPAGAFRQGQPQQAPNLGAAAPGLPRQATRGLDIASTATQLNNARIGGALGGARGALPRRRAIEDFGRRLSAEQNRAAPAPAAVARTSTPQQPPQFTTQPTPYTNRITPIAGARPVVDFSSLFRR